MHLKHFKMRDKSLFLAALLVCLPAYGAVQGTLDNTTSTGSLEITLTIPDRLRISGVSSFNFGQYTGTGNLSDNQDICVYSNTPTAGYYVTLSGDGTSNAFTLNDGSGNLIPYTLQWNDETGTTGAITPVTDARYAQTGANSQSIDCSTGGLSANLAISMLEGNIQNKPNGTYGGTITILVEPN